MQDNAPADQLPDSISDLSRRQYLSIAGVLSASALAGCTGDDDGSSDDGSSDDGTSDDGSGDDGTSDDGSGDDGMDDDGGSGDPQEGGELTVAIGSTIDNLDPAYTQLVIAIMVERQMVETLFHINEDLEVVPLLASDYEVTDGAQPWTVELEERVQFHEPHQREMVADDVVHNINRIRDPDTGAAGASIMNPVEEVTAVDDYTVEFSLSEPAAGFNTALSAHTVAILSPDALEEQGDARNQPVGTGAFVFDEWQTGDYVSVTKNDSYWQEDIPYVDSLRFRPISEPAVQSTELQEGNVEIISGTAPSYVETHQSEGSLNVETVAGGGYTSVHLNSAESPTDNRNPDTPTTDVRVRRAINHALSRTDMVNVISSGYGTTTEEFYPEGNPWRINYERYGDESDPDRAMELLEDAGYDTPLPLQLITPPIDNINQMSVIVEDNLSNAGFDISINEYETGTWVDEFFAHRYDICVNAFPFYPDPSQLRQFYHPDGVYVQPYVDGNNSSDQVMELWSEGNQATDPDERQQIYADLQRTFFDDSVVAIMYHEPAIGSWRDTVSDYSVHPWAQDLNVRSAWLNQ